MDLKEYIKQHKKATYKIASGFIKQELLDFHQRSGEWICIALAQYKCEAPGCVNTTDLTIHHLIPTRNLRCMKACKFYSQKNYFFNIACLCLTCHAKIDSEILSNMHEGKVLTMSQEKIEKIRKFFTRESSSQPLPAGRILP